MPDDLLTRRVKTMFRHHKAAAKKVHAYVNYDAAGLLLLVRESLNARPFCRYCRRALTPKTVSVDHKVPTGRGGSFLRHNLDCAVCVDCNAAKGLCSDEEYEQLMALIRKWHPAAGRALLARLLAGQKLMRSRWRGRKRA